MYKIQLIERTSEDIIKKAIEIDHATFPFKDWITEEDANLIYLNKRDCLIWLTLNDTPVGFATIFPLNENLPIEAMKQSKPIYKLLTQDVLRDMNTGILYCHCFSILPEHRGKGLIYKLHEGLEMWLKEKGDNYSCLYADAVSAEGSRCLRRLGFNPIYSFGKEGTLYKAEKKTVINTIVNKAATL